ncbi:DNA-processing protein DprA [Nocardia sp. NPDC004068]|uniref:DNA-processing protein DprA n=1 Tax=Nocardia sp. NPDC004068 TaxID=3364303 RepID=UPI00369742C1
MSIDDRKTAWAVLSRAARGPSAPLRRLVAAEGVEAAAEAVLAGDVPVAVDRHVLERADLSSARRGLEIAERIGARLATPDDDEWPTASFAAFPVVTSPALGAEPVAPLALWVRGTPSLRSVVERAIAVVGARACSEYGEGVAHDFAVDAVRTGWTVVSGAAFGIDAAAMRSALAAGGVVAAVLPGGIDRPYPAQLSPLLADLVAAGGLLVSEIPPGYAAIRGDFLARNRLIAALSRSVIAVEAGVRSGTRNTVRWAKLLGRQAYAVPGPVYSPNSVGCHAMIRHGDARLATCLGEVINTALADCGDPPTAATSVEEARR